MTPQTVSEKILSAHCGAPARAGEIVICRVDCVIGTDGSGPMAIDYFEQMGGRALFDPARVFFSLDHYAPPDTPETLVFHRRIREFAAAHGATVFEVGDGISHQVAVDRGLVRAGELVVGADSHTVTLGALGAFAIGVGSSDLAAAMLTGRIWLRVPETIRVVLRGHQPTGVAAKDVALKL
ncbi:MAG TPA: aconitase family protein, partial [Vicinamibacterales bacterium]|nr:aconitase family protein [Vicinamibacterales bacterium]